MTEFFPLIKIFDNAQGGFGKTAGFKLFHSAGDSVLDGKSVFSGGRNEAESAVPEFMQMFKAHCAAGLIVSDHIAGIETGQITVEQYEWVFFELHEHELVAEKRLVAGKKEEPGNVCIKTKLQQIIFRFRSPALENMADVVLFRKNRQYPIYERQGELVCYGGKDARNFGA